MKKKIYASEKSDIDIKKFLLLLVKNQFILIILYVKYYLLFGKSH